MTPRGLRNNNPLNIHHSADHFQGEMAGTDKAFKTFSSLAYGYRAAFVILANYNLRGWNTLKNNYSLGTPIENDTENYISQVEKYSGVPRTKELTLANGTEYIMIVAAMSFVENGQNADISQVQAGFNLQTKFKMK